MLISGQCGECGAPWKFEGSYSELEHWGWRKINRVWVCPFCTNNLHRFNKVLKIIFDELGIELDADDVDIEFNLVDDDDAEERDQDDDYDYNTY